MKLLTNPRNEKPMKYRDYRRAKEAARIWSGRVVPSKTRITTYYHVEIS